MKSALVLAAFFWSAFALRVTCLRALTLHREPVPLRAPFSSLPMDICGPGWVGADPPK